MGNKIDIGKSESSNVVGGDVSGNLSQGNSNQPNESHTNAVESTVSALENKGSKLGLFFAILFVLLLIILFVITR